MHRQLFRIISQNPEYVKVLAMILIIHFILHVETFFPKKVHNLTI